MGRNVQFVVEVSKNGRRMSRANLRCLYTHIAEHYAGDDSVDTVTVGWHGGEPLLIEPAYYWATLGDQREIFGGRLPVRNVVRTSLTVVDGERLRLLADGFDGVWVDVAGPDRPERVLGLQTLAGIRDLGCVTVLDETTVGRLETVFRFCERAGLRLRVLPRFDTRDGELAALRWLADRWLGSDDMRIAPDPLDGYVRIAARHLADWPRTRYHDRREGLDTILVDPTGDCYAPGEPYGDPRRSLGNIVTSPVADLHRGPVFDAAVTEAEERQATNCLSCPYFGVCDGVFVTELARRDRDLDRSGVVTCVARPVIEHLEHRLRSSTAVDRLAAASHDPREAAAGVG
jgi:uncharacterized protein